MTHRLNILIDPGCLRTLRAAGANPRTILEYVAANWQGLDADARAAFSKGHPRGRPRGSSTPSVKKAPPVKESPAEQVALLTGAKGAVRKVPRMRNAEQAAEEARIMQDFQNAEVSG